ncbi:membrane-associated ring finger (C3HC4) 2, isoform CRA_a [Rattus norvegicus]|uniref:RING-type E3 ubiquitin transferase n=2 Tax=Muroidea TaxID=337687 RepID=A6KQH8_RAT|nr:membrane-associated ring finger (C3HC4) 2, isoform CRA_a [Rattus norvegicus]
MVCFVFITPLAAISGWLCLRGAQDHLRLHSRLEAVGLIALTIALFTIYVLWTLVSFRYHCQLYSEWRKTNQKVRLKIREADGSEDPHHSLLATGLLKKVAEETPV